MVYKNQVHVSTKYVKIQNSKKKKKNQKQKQKKQKRRREHS